MEDKTLLLGAVTESPAHFTIWDGFKRWLNKRDFPFDYVLYTNYDRLSSALVDARVDVAWNTPVGWLLTRRRAASEGKAVEPIAMRDTDYDLTSVIVTRTDSGISSIQDLKGRVVAVGAADSVEATLMPLGYCRDEGLVPSQDFKVHISDDRVGLHGGNIESERAAARALLAGEADAACLSSYYEKFLSDGTVPREDVSVVAYTPPYDHCNMTVVTGTVPEDLVRRFQDLLFEMSYDDPELHEIFDLEYMKRWRPPRSTNYGAMERAFDQIRL